MVRAIKQTVRIQPGGKIEVVSSELPAGEEAEVIVLLFPRDGNPADCWGLFADEPEIIDRITTEAMAAREQPLRRDRG